MRVAGKIRRVVATAVVSAGALLPMAPSHSASGEEVIKARVNFMEDDIGGHWKPLAAFGKSGTGSLADVDKHAMGLVSLAKKLPSHFPKDTGRGKFPDKLTRALPAIWDNPEGFTKAVQRLSEESEKLARLARDGKKDEVVEMIGKSGSYQRTKIGCADCHNDFRGERAK